MTVACLSELPAPPGVWTLCGRQSAYKAVLECRGECGAWYEGPFCAACAAAMRATPFRCPTCHGELRVDRITTLVNPGACS